MTDPAVAVGLFERCAQLWGTTPEDKRPALPLCGTLRKVCGIEPAAWLGAYVDWESSTAVYREALAVVEGVVAERVDRPMNPEVWAVQHLDELPGIWETASARFPGPVPPAPVLRPGLKKSQVTSLKKPAEVDAARLAAIEVARMLEPEDETLAVG